MLNDYNLQSLQSQAAAERRFTEARLDEARAALRGAEDALERFLEENRQYTSPPLALERERIQRDVMLQQQIVMGLAQHYEDARIREVRNTPVITIVEEPALPVFPDPRGTLRLLILSGVLSGVAASGVVVFRAGWKRQRATDPDPSYDTLSHEWKKLRRRFGQQAGA
jgi:uncharacterized protein involved in exopolysaccharide biosynthesis